MIAALKMATEPESHGHGGNIFVAQFQNVIRHIPFDGRNAGAAYISVKDVMVSCFNFEVWFLTHRRYATKYRVDGKIVMIPIPRQYLTALSNALDGYGRYIQRRFPRIRITTCITNITLAYRFPQGSGRPSFSLRHKSRYSKNSTRTPRKVKIVSAKPFCFK